MKQNDVLEAIIKDIFNTNYRFQQNENEESTAFVEVPRLDMAKVEQLIKELELSCEFGYFTAQQVTENKDDKFDKRIVEIF